MRDHSVRKHARYSASRAGLWFECPAFARLVEALPEEDTGACAAEGTRAAEIAEHCWKTGEPIPEGYEALAVYLDQLKLIADVTEGDQEFAAEPEWVDENIRRAIGPNTGGTPDFVGIDYGRRVVWIADLKWGEGVEVRVANKPQLIVYSLGVLAALDYAGQDLTQYRLRLGICMPRYARPEPWEWWEPAMSASDFFHKYTEIAKDAITASENGEPPDEGPWCDREFCPVGRMAACPVKQAAVAEALPDLAGKMTPKQAAESWPIEKVAAVFREQKRIQQFLKAAEARLRAEAAAGRDCGFVLVEGTPTRRWIDAEAAAEAFRSAGEDPYKHTLRGVSEGDKVLGKAAMAQLTHKVPRGMVLVPADGPRAKDVPWMPEIEET